MLFMAPSDPKFGGPEMQCCKGKVEEGETILEAALREGFEELGLFRGNIKSYKQIPLELGKTTFFVAEIEDPELFGIPHFETGATKWLFLNEFLEQGRKLHKPVVKCAVDTILNGEIHEQKI